MPREIIIEINEHDQLVFNAPALERWLSTMGPTQGTDPIERLEMLIQVLRVMAANQ